MKTDSKIHKPNVQLNLLIKKTAIEGNVTDHSMFINKTFDSGHVIQEVELISENQGFYRQSHVKINNGS